MEEEAAKLCQDYSNYLVVDTSKDVNAVEEAIDDTLTRLEEFSALVDVISSHTDTTSVATEILSRKQELFDLFQRIRKLELTVAQVRQTVNTFDHLVSTAEAELNMTTEGKIKNFLKPLFKKKAPTASASSSETLAPIFTCPPIFSTKELFRQSQPKGTDS